MGEDKEVEKQEKDPIYKIGCLALVVAIITAICAILFNVYGCEDGKDDSSPSGFENITYRDVQRSDISMTYDMGLTSVTVVIQANNDIEEFSGTVQVKGSNGSVIDSERVTYANMRSGSRYEVVFHLSVSQMLEVDSYGIVDISGKVKR